MLTALSRVLKKLNHFCRIQLGVMPLVDREMRRWQRKAQKIPDPELRRQAIASLTAKRFHAEGGSVYAALAPEWTEELVELIVAFQTISDYLDNLCDRSGSLSDGNFRRLHSSMLEAVQPGKELSDHYALHPQDDDGGYLEALVRTCRRRVGELPGYGAVAGRVCHYVSLYVDLQVYKHIEIEQREKRLIPWFEREGEDWPELYWWEFAAATGSTLAVFSLFELATDPRRAGREAEVDQQLEAYFPWVCGLHILLDYFIDQAEDRTERDLNFVSYYHDERQLLKRFELFIVRAREGIVRLPCSSFHQVVFDGLLGLYLSDRKVGKQGMKPLAGRMLAAAGPGSRLTHLFCCFRRFLTEGPAAAPHPRGHRS